MQTEIKMLYSQGGRWAGEVREAGREVREVARQGREGGKGGR